MVTLTGAQLLGANESLPFLLQAVMGRAANGLAEAQRAMDIAVVQERLSDAAAVVERARQLLLTHYGTFNPQLQKAVLNPENADKYREGLEHLLQTDCTVPIDPVTVSGEDIMALVAHPQALALLTPIVRLL
jgi:hypothetical protein